MTDHHVIKLENENSCSVSPVGEEENGESGNSSGKPDLPYGAPQFPGAPKEDWEEAPGSYHTSWPKQAPVRVFFPEAGGVKASEMEERSDGTISAYEGVARVTHMEGNRSGVCEERTMSIEHHSCRAPIFDKRSDDRGEVGGRKETLHSIQLAKQHEELEKDQDHSREEKTMIPMPFPSVVGQFKKPFLCTLPVRDRWSSSSWRCHAAGSRASSVLPSQTTDSRSEATPMRGNPDPSILRTFLPVEPVSWEFAFSCMQYCISMLCLESGHSHSPRNSVFHSTAIPTVSIRDYMKRLDDHRMCNCSALVTGSLLILRFMASRFPVDIYCAHRLLLTGVNVGSLACDDLAHGPNYVSALGGVKPTDLITQQHQFLEALKWNLYIYSEDYREFTSIMQRVLEDPTREEVEEFCRTHAEEIEAFDSSRLSIISEMKWFRSEYLKDSNSKNINSTSSSSRNIKGSRGSSCISSIRCSRSTQIGISSKHNDSSCASDEWNDCEVHCSERSVKVDNNNYRQHNNNNNNNSIINSTTTPNTLSNIHNDARNGIEEESSAVLRSATTTTTTSRSSTTITSSSQSNAPRLIDPQEDISEYFPVDPLNPLSPTSQRTRMKAVLALHRWETIFKPWREDWEQRCAARDAMVESVIQADREEYAREQREEKRVSSPFKPPKSSPSTATAIAATCQANVRALAPAGTEATSFSAKSYPPPSQISANHRGIHPVQTEALSIGQKVWPPHPNALPFRSTFAPMSSNTSSNDNIMRTSLNPPPPPSSLENACSSGLSIASVSWPSAHGVSTKAGSSSTSTHRIRSLGANGAENTSAAAAPGTATASTTHNSAERPHDATHYPGFSHSAAGFPFGGQIGEKGMGGVWPQYNNISFHTECVPHLTKSAQMTNISHASVLNGSTRNHCNSRTSTSTNPSATTGNSSSTANSNSNTMNYNNIFIASTSTATTTTTTAITGSSSRSSSSPEGVPEVFTRPEFPSSKKIEESTTSLSFSPPEMKSLTYAEPYVCSSVPSAFSSISSLSTNAASVPFSGAAPIASAPRSTGTEVPQKNYSALRARRFNGPNEKGVKGEDRWRGIQEVAQERMVRRKRSKPRGFKDVYE